jgi:hypothetical protein
MSQISLPTFVKLNKDKLFEKTYPEWSKTLRKYAKRFINGEECDISQFLCDEARNYYNSYITQLNLYK